MPTLFLDLDGVLADFDKGFYQKFRRPPQSLTQPAVWKCIKSDTDFFIDLPPMDGAKEFFRQIAHLDPVILTACNPDNFQHYARQKRGWVRENISQYAVVLPVHGLRTKHHSCHDATDILIDDWQYNVDMWPGIAIHHTSFENTLTELTK